MTGLREKFGRSNLKDEEWIPKLGAEGGWAVLSADMNIARKRPSRQLFVGAGLVGFFFSPSLQKAPLNLQMARVLTIWPQMVSHMNTTANGRSRCRLAGGSFALSEGESSMAVVTVTPAS